ncbi:MAG: hypothetical protein JSS12_11660, partial [Verrucomicrobia bacterium]|nr:hypothetical protein [Verrucomicrobiota bacterium]
MNILLTTYGLILIFVLFCGAQWRSATDMIFMDIVSTDTFAICRDQALDILNNRSQEQYEKLSPKAPPTKSKAIANKVDSSKQAETTALLDTEEEPSPIQIDRRDDEPDEKKPKQQQKQKCTSLLHIGALIKQDDININEGKGRAIFQLLHNLITEMYKNERFFINALEKDGDFVNQFLINMIDRAKETHQGRKLKTAKDLTTVNLEDKLQSYVRYKMFRGTKSRLSKKQTQDDPGYYPLAEFTSLNLRSGNTIMSVWLADRPLLMALFQDDKIVDEVIECRREIFNDMRKRKAAGMNVSNENSKELELRFGGLIPDNLRQYI